MTRCSPCSWGRLPVIRVTGRAGGPVQLDIEARSLVAMLPGADPAAGERLPVLRVILLPRYRLPAGLFVVAN
ncbi:hypothetical protein [Aeromonas hydrophila]|uniref:hypothetical protein n=1 Tax=Aeromonas hydrophila TaxID=644 RepID=UPI0023606BE6|nr:hypothetical protein [Aeromonas hydrophila]